MSMTVEERRKFHGLKRRLEYANARYNNSISGSLTAPTKQGRKVCKELAKKELAIIKKLEAEYLTYQNHQQ